MPVGADNMLLGLEILVTDIGLKFSIVGQKQWALECIGDYFSGEHVTTSKYESFEDIGRQFFFNIFFSYFQSEIS